LFNKIKAHFGPLPKPELEQLSTSPKEQVDTMMHDMNIIFPGFNTMSRESKGPYIDALIKFIDVRRKEYFSNLATEKPALYETLSKLMRL